MPTEPLPPPLPGDQVGPYRLEASLGVGGMAAVYRGSGPDGKVAVKILHQSRVTAIEEVKRFRREFITLERLRHPNIVAVYETGEHNGYPWIAMELVEGSDLGALLETWQADPPPDRFDRVRRIFTELCEALAYVHEQGVIHRDLKPGNVLVGKDGHTHLTDFGVVKDSESFNTNLTLAGRLVGTVAFMAPEQITGESPDARADLYSLGALLYMMLTYRRPISADSIAGYLARHLTETPRPPSDLDARVPRRLERICMKLLQKDPARRYATARQVLEALAEDEDTAEFLPLHGREPALERALDAVSGLARRGVGGVVAVTGPPGSGRTRFLQELVDRARVMGVSAAFAGVHDTLASLSASLPAVERAPPGIAGLRARITGRPWLLVVDDADRLPADVQEALAGLVRDEVAVEGNPLLLVVSARVDSGCGLVTGTATGLDAEEIPLGPLDRDAVRALLRDRGLHGALGAAMGRRLQEEIAGSPGPILEQLEAMIRAGWLARGADGTIRAIRSVELLRTEPLPLPERVREAEAAFLGKLAPLDRAVLEALSVLGAPSTAALVAPMVGLTEPELGPMLLVLSRVGHLAAQEDGLQELYAVGTRRRSQVIYETMAPERRAELHRAAADALLRLHKRRLTSVAETAAHHLLHGGDPGGAYPLLIQGAQRALRRGDPAGARTLCLRAAEARGIAETQLNPADGLRWRRQLYQALGEASRALGQPEAGSDAFSQALIAARLEGDRPGAGKALAGVGLCALARGRPGDAAGALEESLGLLERGEGTWPEAAHALALCRFAAGNLDGADRLWRECVDLGQATRSVTAELGGLWGGALVARARGHRADAVALLDRALDRGREGGGEALVRVLQQRGDLALAEGDWSAAARLGDDLDALGDTANLPAATALGGALRAAALLGMEERGTAQRAARDALALCRLNQVRLLFAWALCARVLGGEAEEAATRLREGDWMPEPPYDGEALRQAALAHALVTRKPADARTAALAALARPAALVASAAARVELDAGAVLLRLGDRDAAARAADRALLRLDDKVHRALVREGCLILLAAAPTPELAARLKRVGG